MPPVDFANLGPSRDEDMNSVLLSRLRQARRVDGSGGDGGRDCYFSGEDGTDVYELKSFTGRMTSARRQQVKRSLARAMLTSPRTWTLVVPIDPTPDEKRWFDSLGTGLSTRLEWLGKTWLEEQVARFPDIIRYFSGAADEVVRILTKISDENALPDNAAGLAERFAGQASVEIAQMGQGSRICGDPVSERSDDPRHHRHVVARLSDPLRASPGPAFTRHDLLQSRKSGGNRRLPLSDLGFCGGNLKLPQKSARAGPWVPPALHRRSRMPYTASGKPDCATMG